MAKYINRLVHFYAEVSTKELYQIIRDDLDDFDILLRAIQQVLSHPEKFDLTVE